MTNIQQPGRVNITAATNVRSDVERTRQFCDENPETEFVEPPEAN